MIIHCSKDERGQYTGGTAGDQTGQECCKRTWYSHPWTCLLRHRDGNIGIRIADLAEQAAENNKIGYDQTDRQTFWNALSVSSYEPKNITTACEADCSSFVCSIIKAVGFLSGNTTLQNLNPFLTTYTMRNALLAAGFTEVSTNLASESGAKKGDIWLNDSQHTCIQVTDGGGATKVTTLPTANTGTAVNELSYMAGRYPVIKPANAGKKYPEVSALQALLNLHGYTLTCDGYYGAQTQNAVYLWQAKNGLTPDKEAGADTFLSLMQKT